MAGTLASLIAAGLLQPGDGVLEQTYQGETYSLDLLADGAIRIPRLHPGMQPDMVFVTPSAAAVAVVRQRTPSRRAVDGWHELFYRGRRLEAWREDLGGSQGSEDEGEGQAAATVAEQEEEEWVPSGRSQLVAAPAVAAAPAKPTGGARMATRGAGKVTAGAGKGIAGAGGHSDGRWRNAPTSGRPMQAWSDDPSLLVPSGTVVQH